MADWIVLVLFLLVYVSLGHLHRRLKRIERFPRSLTIENSRCERPEIDAWFPQSYGSGAGNAAPSRSQISGVVESGAISFGAGELSPDSLSISSQGNCDDPAPIPPRKEAGKQVQEKKEKAA